MGIISSVLEQWKPGPNVVTHHKGKMSDRHNLFVHHCTTFPNPLQFVMISGLNGFSFPQETSGSYVVITQWCQGPNPWGLWEGLRDDQRARRRKLWIPLTNHGRNDGDSGFPLIPFFLQRGFGSLPNCSVVNARRGCARFNKSKFLLKAAGNKQNKNETMEGDPCKMSFRFKTISSRHSLSCVPFSHCPWMGISTWKH